MHKGRRKATLTEARGSHKSGQLNLSWELGGFGSSEESRLAIAVQVGAGSVRCYQHTVLRDEPTGRGKTKRQSSEPQKVTFSYHTLDRLASNFRVCVTNAWVPRSWITASDIYQHI